MKAFAAGLARHGIDCEIHADPPQMRGCSPDLLVLWSVRRRDEIARQRAEGNEVCILECGYLGDRVNEWVSVSLGGELNGRARFAPRGDDGERFTRLWGHMVRPWHGGTVGLICAQCPGDMSVQDCPNLEAFYSDAAMALAVAGFRPVFRPHPLQPMKPPAGVEVDTGTLDDALAGAGVVVTWSSNSAVDAITAGVPVVCGSELCMSRPISAHWPDCRATTPDRWQWFADLAWKQWSIDEIANGDAWEAVRAA
jgi:hypothetical protein